MRADGEAPQGELQRLRGWATERRLQLLLALSALTGSIPAYLWASPGEGVRGFVAGAVPSAAVVVASYLIVSFVLWRGGPSSLLELEDGLVRRLSSTPGVQRVVERFEDAQWDLLFRQSRQVEIVARFFDGVVKTPRMTEFFERGGVLRVVALDPRDDAAMAVTGIQRHGDPDLWPDEVTTRVVRGLRSAHGALRGAQRRSPGSAGQLDVYFADWPLNFAGYCFDRKTLVINAYEHFFTASTRSPRFQIDLAEAEAFRRFWNHEIAGLTRPENQVADIEGFLESLRLEVAFDQA